jgi:hypothetical protein
VADTDEMTAAYARVKLGVNLNRDLTGDSAIT